MGDVFNMCHVVRGRGTQTSPYRIIVFVRLNDKTLIKPATTDSILWANQEDLFLAYDNHKTAIWKMEAGAADADWVLELNHVGGGAIRQELADKLMEGGFIKAGNVVDAMPQYTTTDSQPMA